MAGWNPMTAIKNAINKLLAVIVNANVTVFQPILDAISKIIGIFSAPFLTIFAGFISTFIVGIIDSILYYFFPRDFGEKSKDDNGNWYTNPIGGWKWLCNMGFDILSVAIYFICLVGYFFATRLAGIFLIFLSLSMLITISIIPFLPMIYFIYICIKNSQTIAKLSKNIIIGYVNEAIYNVRETKKFFSNNVINILLKIVLIFSYQIFLFICDIFLSLPIIIDQLSKFGIIAQILVNIIIYYPIWWFLYSLYANRNNGVDLPNKILNAIDSVTNTFWSVWNWVNRKSSAIIQALKSK